MSRSTGRAGGSEAKRMRDLDQNARLKQMVADLNLDREALQWLIEKNG